MIVTGLGAVSGWFSTTLHWGAWILDQLQRADFLNTKFLELLRWFFSPDGAHVLTGVFLAAFLVAVYRTVNPKERLARSLGQQENEEQIPVEDAEQLRGRIAELERENATLEQARESASKLYEKARQDNDALQVSLTSKINELESLEWLRRNADDQLNDLRKYVLVETCEINISHLSDGKRYVEFTFHVVNYSIFNVSIPMSEYDLLKGSIRFKGDPLSGEAKLIENKVVGLKPYMSRHFKVFQWVNPDEARDISETLKNVGNLFNFSNAIVYVRADKFPDAEAAKLDLMRGMQNADLENRIIQLEALKATYESEISVQKGRAEIIRGLEYLRGMTQLARVQLGYGSGDTFTLLHLNNAIGDVLRSCFNNPQIIEDYYDGEPPIGRNVPESTEEQKQWVELHYHKLGKLIDEQRPENKK